MADMNISIPQKKTIVMSGKSERELHFESVGTRNHQKLNNLDYESSGHTGFQKELTFDEAPTAGSANPVTSGGVKAELDKKVNKSDIFPDVYSVKLGNSAEVVRSIAIGYNAKAKAINGISIGSNAKCNINAIQLGTGTNPNAKTLQIYDYQLMDANGNIPSERLANAPKTEVVDNLTSTDTDKALSANQGNQLKILVNSKADNTDIEILKKLSVPHTTASGYPVSVSDHLEGESVIDYKVYGNSVQDGTPTPDTPVEIQSVGGLVTDTSSPYYGKYDVPVTVCGKNLLSYPYYDTTVTRNGITFTDNGDGTITANGTATANTQFYLYKHFSASTRIHIMGNYRLSGCPSGGSYTSYTLTIDCFDDDENRYYLSDLGHSVKITEKNFSNICYIQIYKDTTLDNIVFKPQLEYGQTATEYEPYSGETKHIYLDEPIYNLDYVDWENQKVVRKIGVMDDFSNITFSYNSESNYFQTIPIPAFYADTTLRTNSLCNYFKYGLNLSSDCFWIDSSGRGLRIKTDKYDGTTASEFNGWINSIPIKIYYPLAAPAEETITAPDFTVPNSEVMNISSGTSTPPSSMDAGYYQDINKVITELKNAILAQGGNV